MVTIDINIKSSIFKLQFLVFYYIYYCEYQGVNMLGPGLFLKGYNKVGGGQYASRYRDSYC